MKSQIRLSPVSLASAIALLTTSGFAQTAPAATPAAGPYKVLSTTQFMGTGGIDYVNVDSANRKVYVARGTDMQIYDLDTLKLAATLPIGRAHGAAIDPASNQAFCTTKPITMVDTKALKVIKTITVDGSPDGAFFEPLNEQAYILSHGQPNVTVINGKDGTVAGTIDLGGAPEQGASDGKGKVYIDIEDGNNVAVVDTKAMKVLAHYDLGDKGGQPAGLALDAKNGIIFSYCRTTQSCVIVNAADGKIITSLPTGNGCDSAWFNPATMEAFSSQGDGTLTVIKENSPTDFVVEQTVQTKTGAKTSALDTKTNDVILICTERAPTPATPAASAAATPPAAAAPAASAPTAGSGRRGGGRGGRGGNTGPGNLDLIVVGK
jgi:hypothetical protein